MYLFKCRKFEEIYPPEVAEFVYITDDTYNKKQVLRMEHLVLKVLSFDLAAPTINQFLTHYFLRKSVDKRVESLAMVSLQQIQSSFGNVALLFALVSKHFIGEVAKMNSQACKPNLATIDSILVIN